MNKTILFRHISKTAGTTFKFILANNFGLSFCNSMAARPLVIDPSYWNVIKSFYPRIRALGGHNVSLTDEFLSDDFFRVTFIREPVNRTISHFQHYCIGIDNIDDAMSHFEVWINKPENCNHQLKKIGLTDDYEAAIKTIDETYDFIGLTEKFDASMQILNQIAPVSLDKSYKSKQKSKSREIKKRIKNSGKFMNMVKRNNELDLRLYEYIREQYFEKYYFKHYDVNENKKYDFIQSKYTTNALLSKWYSKYIFRTYFKLKYI